MSTYVPHAPSSLTERRANVRAAGAWAALASVVSVVVLVLGGGAWAVWSLTAHPGALRGASVSAPAVNGGSTQTMPGMGTGSGAATLDADNVVASATSVPAPITRTVPATVRYELTTSMVTAHLDKNTTYQFWTFNGTVPGPMMRVLQGDTVVIHLRNNDTDMAHSIDLHAASGPGGGASLTQTLPGHDSTFSFKALNPGLYIYHCATPPVSQHIANGMYGMILVEPRGGLPKVDHEFYLVQGEFYTSTAFGASGFAAYSAANAQLEHPTYVVFNGMNGSFMGQRALHATVGQKIRIYLGVGTWIPSNFHVIGNILDNVYPDGGIGGTVEHNIQTVIVPAGGSTIVEFTPKVPGTYTFVDHSMPHMDAGAMGQIVVTGAANPAIFRAGT